MVTVLAKLSVVPFVISSTLFCTAALLVDRISLQDLQSVQQPPGHSAVRTVLKSIF